MSRAHCPVCGLDVALTSRGRVYAHKAMQGLDFKPCPGSSAQVDSAARPETRDEYIQRQADTPPPGWSPNPPTPEPPPAPPTSVPLQDDADGGSSPAPRRPAPLLPYELALSCDRCKVVEWVDEYSSHAAPGTLTPCVGVLARRPGWSPNREQAVRLSGSFNFDAFELLTRGATISPSTVAVWIGQLPLAVAFDPRWAEWLEQRISNRDELLEVRYRLGGSHAGGLVRDRLGDPDDWEWPAPAAPATSASGAASDPAPAVPGGPSDQPTEAAPLPPAPPGARWLTPEQAGQLRPHPAADLFPAMDALSIASLREDLREHGQLEAVEVAGDLIIDGRHRVAALLELRRPVLVRDAPAGADLVARSVSLNLHRRHLSTGERASIAARLRPAIEAARGTTAHQLGLLSGAPERPAWRADPAAGGWRCTACAELVVAAGQPVDPCRTCARRAAPVPADAGRHWSDVAGDLLGVSARSVEQAAAVQRAGAPELVAALDRGDLAPSVAADLSRLSREQQREVLAAADPKELIRAARSAREQASVQRREKRRAELDARAADLAAGDPALARAGSIDLRVCRVAELVRDPLLAGQAHLIVADPPWAFNNGGNGAASSKYATMPMEEIRSDLREAVAITHDDAVLAVWIPPAMLEAWFSAPLRGWEYVSGGAWTKTGQLGVGGLWRGQVELLLLYRVGRPLPVDVVRNAAVTAEPVGEHSEKPITWLEDLVNAWVPEGGCVVDLYAGLGSLARAVDRVGSRRYVGAEADKARAKQARDLLTIDRTKRWE